MQYYLKIMDYYTIYYQFFFDANLLLVCCFFASESLALRFFPFFSVCFPLWNGEKTNVEQMYNECRTRVERRMNGE